MDGKEKIIAHTVDGLRAFYNDYIATGDESIPAWNERVHAAREIIAAALLPNIHPTPCYRRCAGTPGVSCAWGCPACGGSRKVMDKLCADTTCTTCLPARKIRGYFNVVPENLPTEGRTRDRTGVTMPALAPLPPSEQALQQVVEEPGKTYGSGRHWAVLCYPIRANDVNMVIYQLTGGTGMRLVSRQDGGWVEATLPGVLQPAYEVLRANGWRVAPMNYGELLP